MSKEISYTQELLRKGVHLSSLWMVIAIGILPGKVSLAVFAGLLVAILVTEYGHYKKWPLIHSLYAAVFGSMLREKEKQADSFRPSGAVYVLAAALLCDLLFPKVIAMTALSVMLIGDTAAALIGRKFGKTKIAGGRKSLEGCLSFIAAGFAIVCFFYFFFSLPVSFLVAGAFGVTAAALAETYEDVIRIDDNFSVPVVAGLFLCIPLFF